MELELFDTKPSPTRNATFFLNEVRMFHTKTIEKEKCISKLKVLQDFFDSNKNTSENLPLIVLLKDWLKLAHSYIGLCHSSGDSFHIA